MFSGLRGHLLWARPCSPQERFWVCGRMGRGHRRQERGNHVGVISPRIAVTVAGDFSADVSKDKPIS